jgi:DNA-binding CsgD family transcriptional regulator
MAGLFRMEIHNLIDEIYEAAIVPELWMRTLDRLSEIAGAEGAVLFAWRQEARNVLFTHSIEPLVRLWIDEGWLERDDRGQRLIPRLEPRFLTDLDAFTPEELETAPIYRDLFRPNGFGWCAGTAIHSPTSDSVVFSIERKFHKGPVEAAAVAELDRLRPHLARAAVLSARAGEERARSQVVALETVGLPAVVLSSAGRAVAANALFDRYASVIRIGARDALSFAERESQVAFLASPSLRGAEKSVGAAKSLPLRATPTSPAAVAHLFPLQGVGRDVFSDASYLLYLTPLSERAALPAPILQALYDLTPAEARVTAMIAAGDPVDDIASRLGVQANTVRMQLKSVFLKTGARRQADLCDLASTLAHHPQQA